MLVDWGRGIVPLATNHHQVPNNYSITTSITKKLHADNELVEHVLNQHTNVFVIVYDSNKKYFAQIARLMAI